MMFVRTRSQLLAALLAVLVGAGNAAAQSDNSEHGGLAPFQSAEVCRDCHMKEYQQWRESWMSRAWSAHNFQHDYQALLAAGSSDPRLSPRACLRCHAPLALVLRDRDMTRATSTEGVTCDFCHSIASVSQGNGPGKLGLDPRGVRYGAGEAAKGAPHAVGTSAALRDPRLCGMCHSDFDANGIPLERTYREWREGPYAREGVVCVDCHMAPTREGDGARSHRFPGGHADSPLLPGAAIVSLAGVTAGRVALEVYNARVGHNFPTAGAHPNALYLDAIVLDGDGAELERHRRRFAFTYLDAQGNEVEGSGVVTSTDDTTLAPRERRRINLPLADGARRIRATLTYVALPAHLKHRVGDSEYAAHYAPVEVHRIERDL